MQSAAAVRCKNGFGSITMTQQPPTVERPRSAPSSDSPLPPDDHEPHLRPTLRKRGLGELRVDLAPGRLDGLDLPAVSEGVADVPGAGPASRFSKVVRSIELLATRLLSGMIMGSLHVVTV